MHNNRFKKTGFGIEMSLPKTDYLVRANILKIGDKESHTYDITLELRTSDIGKWDMLDEERFSITSENINIDTCNFIMDKFSNGYFDRFINRYEYEMNCFDRGNELFENERLANVK